ncbi:MAG TPA: translation elongation factor-like protein, partial [Candidatus Nanoarchaeia archaeon]|nr:translation elongation factor-like protein [Candidatus Nanoarchaeia archaeon]
KEKIIGDVMNYFDHVSVAAIRLEAPLKIGDTVRIVGGETDFEQKIESMQINRKSVKTAKKGDEIGIKVSEKVRKGYKVFKK